MEAVLIWRDAAAEAQYNACEEIIFEIRKSYEVSSANATATEIMKCNIPGERQRMLHRMEKECQPWADAMGDLERKYASPVFFVAGADGKETG